MTRLGGSHGTGAVVTRACHWGGEPGQAVGVQAAGRELIGNRRGNRRVVLRVPRHTTVCGSAPAIASRRTVSRETPSRRASCAAVRKSAAPPTRAAQGPAVAG